MSWRDAPVVGGGGWESAPRIDAEPTSVKAGRTIADIPRQLGLTARYGIEGLAGLAQIGTEPLRYLQDRLTGMPSRPLGALASELADSLGLPRPEGADERVIGDASRLVTGAGGIGAVGRVAQGAPGLVQKAGELFGKNLGTQATAAAGSGLAGGSVREAGGSPAMQFGASMLGGITGGLGANAASATARDLSARARALLTPPKPEAVEQQITLALRGSGVDWSLLPERVKQALRQEVTDAMKSDQPLSGDAIRRLADFRMVPGTTPSRGMLTQDPVQITREQNLAKTGANSLDIGLQRLPRLQQQNTNALLEALDTAGARNAPDTFAAGQRVIGALEGNVKASKAPIDALYAAARDTSGRSAPLDGAAFTQRANQLLDERLLGYALPETVSKRLNEIAAGKAPFTVDYAEQLKTSIGNLQRATNDRATKYALGTVREALDATPLRPAPQVNPGNLPAVPGTVPTSPAVLGQESIDAFNKARAANAAFMQRVEKTPALQAVMDGVEPDKFVQQFITGGSASVADVRALASAVASDPGARETIRQTIAAHLKSAATNGTEDVAKFSPASYNRALNNIGDRKLSAFFSPEEVEQLRAIGRVSTYMKAQPDGTAVNNSNTGALLLGRGMDMLESVAGKLPLGLDTTIQGLLRGQQQSSALNVPAALQLPRQPMPGLLQPLGASSLLFGGGLLSPYQPPQQR